MPFNPATGKTDRHKYTEQQLLEFRSQVREGAPKGKKPAASLAFKPSESHQEQAPSSMPSTLLPLNLPPTRRLRLPPSTSSPADAAATDTREDDPAGSSLSSPDHPYDNLPAANVRKRRAAPKLAAATVTAHTSAVASTSRPPPSRGNSDSEPSHLPPWLQQAGSHLQPSCGDQSQARDDGDSAAANDRKLKERLDAIEKRQRNIDRRLKKAQALLSL